MLVSTAIILSMSLTAKDRLVLIRVKIERAKKHLREMEAEVVPIQNQNLHVFGMKDDPDTGQRRPYFGPLPIIPFNLIATGGDIAQNLRSALDHLAWQLVSVGTPDAKPSRDTSFPICPSIKEYESRKGRKVKGMRPEAIAAIDALKPYKGGNGALWRLHEINNIDKHRLILTIAHDCLFTGEDFMGGYWLKASDPLFDGIVSSEAKNEIHFGVDESLTKTEISERQALLPTLHQLVDFVDDLVSSFEPLLE